MAVLHIDHLNRDYHPDVIRRWKDQGCYDTIAVKIGYRFVLDSASLPDSVKPGGVLRVGFSLRNVGVGELFNPRDVEVRLLGPGRPPGNHGEGIFPRWPGGRLAQLRVWVVVR